MSAPPPAGSPPPPAGSPPPPVVPPPAGGGHAAPRRLTRQLSGRMLGGVASGLAAYLGVDVVVVRIAFVVLAFVPFPGFGLLVYGAMLLLVPAAEDGETVLGRTSERGAGFYVGLALVGLATFWLFGAVVAGFGMFQGGRGGLLPLLLIGLGIALWVDADRRRASRATDEALSWSPPAGPAWSPAASTPPESTVGAAAAGTTSASEAPPAGPVSADRAADQVGPPDASAAGGAPPAWMPPAGPAPAWEAPPPPRARPRSPLGRITVGLALLAGGIAWLVDVTTAWRVPLSATLAIVVGVLGIGLLIGSVAGRARWLALLVAFLLPVTFAAAAVEDLGIEVTDGVGSRSVGLTTTDELTEPYRIGAGELRIDLTGVREPRDERLNASVGAGELVVLIPEGSGLLGNFRVEVGEIDVLGASSAGLSLDRDVEVAAEAGMPTYLMDLRVGAGSVQVRTVEPDAVAEPWLDDEPFDEDLLLEDDAALEDDAVLEDQPTEEVAP